MKKISIYLLAVSLCANTAEISARENMNGKSGKLAASSAPRGTVALDCTAPTAQTDLAVNNVRARLLMADMWWDLNDPKYEIPKDSKKHSLFAGSLWIGGIDAGSGNLKVAAQTYRQTGTDFWPGPLRVSDASIESKMCTEYDRHFKISIKEVEEFYGWRQDPASNPDYVIPPSILKWPGNGDIAQGQTQFLAPFHDENGDGTYDPNSGDYPAYNLTGPAMDCKTKDFIYGDETLWWVFNDKGNIHTETKGDAIGLEIHAQAFAFRTNDDLNNMTFYSYKIFNRSSSAISNTYFGQWCDADLGQYDDDYVGCDVGRGLGYIYNGKEIDGTGAGNSYGANPPAVGMDFFQGPLADPGDGLDNDRDGQIDEDGEQIIMSKFVYYNNDGSDIGNPGSANDYYNYLQGIWRDGTPMTFGGNGHQSGGPVTNFMFPGDTDPSGVFWDEVSSGNLPADRRMLQSAGAFTLQPGAVNYITTGVVWARATSGGRLASVALMRKADDVAQGLFDRCFELPKGPDAPDISIRELDRKLILTLSNAKTSNNYREQYTEIDPNIKTPPGFPERYDSTYNFQGYIIYQLINNNVSPTEFNNPDRARIVAQVDIRDNVSTIINYNFDPTLGTVPRQEVVGENKGIKHSFVITDDLFAQGNTELVNYKTYHYTAITYGHNEYKPYKTDQPFDPANPFGADMTGQKLPFKTGRRNIETVSAIPHIPAMGANGIIIHSEYGQGVEVKRIEGQGNGGSILDLTKESQDKIFNNGFLDTLIYVEGKAPINVKVVDPLNVPHAKFEFRMQDTLRVPPNDLSDASWTLTNLTTGQVVNSEQTISVENEQIIPEWGVSVSVGQVSEPGTITSLNNGFLEATMTFADETKPWLGGIPDIDLAGPYDWIRAGTLTLDASPDYADYIGLDEKEVYEGILPASYPGVPPGGTWAPYRLSSETYSPGAKSFMTAARLENLASVNIVITPDKSKWSRCPVFETQEDSLFAVDKAKKLDLRRSGSVDKEGNQDNSGTNGMGWFPGYAVNVETGERLNIAFGEDSYLAEENGDNMKWDPTSDFSENFGGRHYIYVFGHNGDAKYPSADTYLGGKLRDVPRYDEGKMIYESLQAYRSSTKGGLGTTPYKRNVFKDAMWVSIPVLLPGQKLLDNEVTIRLRVGKPFRSQYAGTVDTLNGTTNPVNANRPMYLFSTEDLAAEAGNAEAAKNALELINVVPNPYYAFSGYETSQFDKRIKITNLPQKCVISIYTLSGTLVRRFNKDSDITYQDWDLKNNANIPIASGAYLIHVDAEGIGEKVVKWFGVMRPIDLDTF